MCWVVRCEATVQISNQTTPTKQNMKIYFFGDFHSADFGSKALKINKVFMNKFLKKSVIQYQLKTESYTTHTKN